MLSTILFRTVLNLTVMCYFILRWFVLLILFCFACLFCFILCWCMVFYLFCCLGKINEISTWIMLFENPGSGNIQHFKIVECSHPWIFFAVKKCNIYFENWVGAILTCLKYITKIATRLCLSIFIFPSFPNSISAFLCTHVSRSHTQCIIL